MLHLSAVLLINNYQLSEDSDRLSDFKDRYQISAVFSEIITENENTSQNNPEKNSLADKSESPEQIEFPLDSKKSEQNISNKTIETIKKNKESLNSSENTERSDKDSRVPETLSIDSFTTDLKPVYPKFARKNSYEGIVKLSLTVNREGRSENVQIIKSSGYSVLDKAALKAVKKARFKSVNSRIYYLAAALNKPLLIDINFSLKNSLQES